MLKKFVSVSANTSPSPNPYEVRTYLCDCVRPDWKPELCASERKCDPGASTISKVLTIEDELRRLHQKTKESRFQRPFKKKCEQSDVFTECIVPQRTPRDLKIHARAREHFIRADIGLRARLHDGTDLEPETPSLVRLASPMGQEEGEEPDDADEGEEEEGGAKKVKPKLASPSCSLDVIFKPPQKLLELHRPKSRMFLNESLRPELNDTSIPYSSYNPRLMQKCFDDQNLAKIDIIKQEDQPDMWTWNLGLQKSEGDLNREYQQAMIPEFDCNKIELNFYDIPKDMHKTFAAEIVVGSSAIVPPKPSLKPTKRTSFYNRPPEIAAIYICYAETFYFNPDFWQFDTLDNILKATEKLILKSTKLNYKSPDTDFDILPQIAERQATIGLKVHYTGPLKEEPNIFKALTLFFSKFNAAVLCCKNLYLLIWKRCNNTFYIFDPNGRTHYCQRDFERGKCSLMSTRCVDHLVHLTMSFSDIDLDGDFNLYEIFLINYGKITQPLPTKPAPKLTHKLWAVVNNQFALIPAANNGLQQPISGTQNNASMIISLMALLYSDIHRPVLWRLEVVDDLVRFGQNFFKFFVRRLKLKKKQQLNIVDLPEAIMLGAFQATLKKRPFFYTGHIVNCTSYKDSQLTHALKELFASKWESALLQIDNMVLGVWRDREYFYIFDPFRRGKAGQVLDPEDFLTKGVACLQIHTDLESVYRILYTKALNMRRGGKFFVHGVSVGCIKPLVSELNYRNKYTNLRLTYPKLEDDPASIEKPEPPSPPSSKKKTKKQKVERKFSIQSIPSKDYIPEFDTVDVVDGMLEDVLCEVLKNLPEPKLRRPLKYKQAERILLKSDKQYLKQLHYDMQHGTDFDNINVAFQKYPEPPPQPLTLEQELMIPSNFVLLPDGTWVVFGTKQLPLTEDNESKLSGLLSTIVAAALSAKYKISTWNDKLVDYAVEASKGFGEQFQNYERTLDVLLSKRVPKLNIGSTRFRVEVKKVHHSAPTRPLRQVLLESLISFNQVLMICQRFSCLIIKRYNFLYVFIGYPCNAIGYRKFGAGPPCLLRIVELDSLIRRIEFGCNPQGCEVTNYVLVALALHDITKEPPQRFKTWPASDEYEMYSAEWLAKEKERRHKMDKFRFLDDELRRETDRIQSFLTEKQRILEERRLAVEMRCHPKRYAHRQARLRRKELLGLEEGGEELVEEEFEEEGEEEEGEIELKHKPGRKLKRMAPDEFKPRPILYGYRMREKDCLFKIQGTTALEGRELNPLTEIKTCFFASVLSILYAIMRPLNQWSSQRVDRVIEGSRVIVSKVPTMTTAFDRVIKNITVDDYDFEVWAKTYEPMGVYGSSLGRKIAKAMQTRRYLLLQTPNATFAVYQDEYYHLFDPYPSMETINAKQEGEEEGAEEGGQSKRKKCPKESKRYGERNTASWVLFADLESLLEYIDKRTVNSFWKEDQEYKFHVVDVLSYKKASPKTRILQLLTDLSVPMECDTSHHGQDEKEICAISETVTWLDLENCLPVWSRMNRRNSSGKYRNLPVTKLKKYDIEIEGRLWSLWGTLHPRAPVFATESRGKQYLACNVVACCAASVYRLTDWSSQLLDNIVISGDRYHRESLANIKRADYEFSLEDLNIECTLENIHFVVHMEHRVYGTLYCHPTRTRMNLADALMYFFSNFQFGILQCNERSLAIGRTMGHDGGYFMFDCQSKEHPLFPKGQGASYVLRTRHLQMLLYCIIITLNVTYFNVQFTIHQVAMLREGASLERDEMEEEEEEG